MKERPILFSGPMVRALLVGTKTQTRRIIKAQPAEFVQVTPDRHPTTRTAPYIDAYCGEKKTAQNPRGMSREWHWWTADNRLGEHLARCPYGIPGDRLWLRESCCPNYGGPMIPAYRADWSTRSGEFASEPRWTPSIHMPRRASRITLEITNVRVERLQEISESDAVAEGLKSMPPCFGHGWQSLPPSGDGWCAPTLAYRELWESINGPNSWDLNPYVWVIEFKKLPKETT